MPRYDERILLAAAVVDAKVAVAPWPGTIFSDYPDQDYKRIFRTEPNSQTDQWYVLAAAVGDLLQDRGDAWQAPVRDLFQATTSHIYLACCGTTAPIRTLGARRIRSPRPSGA